MTLKARYPAARWITGAAVLCSATALLLGLARLFGWLSRMQINYLAN